MSRDLRRALVTTAAVAGLSGCAAIPPQHHWVRVKPVRAMPHSELTAVDGDYRAAVAAIERRDYGLALDLLQTANAEKSGDVRILNAFGVVYDKLGRFDLSSRYYARAHAADASSTIVANNEAYSAMLQARSPAIPGASGLLANKATLPPAASPAPIRLAAAPDVATSAGRSSAPATAAPPAAVVDQAAPRSVRVASPNLLKNLVRYLMPRPAAQQDPSVAPSVRPAAVHIAFEPALASAAPHIPMALAGPPIILRSVAQADGPQVIAQPGVVRLAAISPNAVQVLPPPAHRLGLEIADGSGRPGAAAPIRLQLAQLGWTTRKGPIAVAPRISRTTITYAAYRAPVALSLARTLPRGVKLVDCGDTCGGIRLTLGSDSLAWPSRIRAALKVFG